MLVGWRLRWRLDICDGVRNTELLLFEVVCVCARATIDGDAVNVYLDHVYVCTSWLFVPHVYW